MPASTDITPQLLVTRRPGHPLTVSHGTGDSCSSQSRCWPPLPTLIADIGSGFCLEYELHFFFKHQISFLTGNASGGIKIG